MSDILVMKNKSWDSSHFADLFGKLEKSGGHNFHYLQKVDNIQKTTDKSNYDLIILGMDKLDTHVGEVISKIQKSFPAPAILILNSNGNITGNFTNLTSNVDCYLSEGLFDQNALEHAISGSINKRKEDNRLHKTITEQQKIIDSCPVGIIATDKVNKIRFMNDKARLIFRNMDDVAMGQCLNQNLNKTGHIIIKEKNGKELFLHINVHKSGWVDENGKIFYIQDNTVNEKTKEQLINADKHKTDFLANVSHEIRTPMNAIIGFVDLLSQNPSEENVKVFINYIKSSSNQLLNLIDDIIDITKIEKGKISVKKSDVEINKLLLELLETYNIIIETKGLNNVELRLNMEIMNENFVINTDPYRIRQILSNLLNNAVKFTSKGYIEFGYQFNNKNNIVFYVQDSGTGISEDQMINLFNRYQSNKLQRDSRDKGAGLGLAISRKLVELLGGELKVRSEVGKGSRFFFGIPLSNHGDSSNISHYQEKKDMDFSHKKVLIVEDDDYSSLFIKTLLVPTNVQVIKAYNGKQAINICRTEKGLDLVLMDIKLPEIDGIMATKEIRKFNPDIPIIAQTAHDLDGDEEKCKLAGCNAYITKPLNPALLMKYVTKFLQDK